MFSILIFYATAAINIQCTVRPDKTSRVFSRKSIRGSNQAWCLTRLPKKPFVRPVNLEIIGTL